MEAEMPGVDSAARRRVPVRKQRRAARTRSPFLRKAASLEGAAGQVRKAGGTAGCLEGQGARRSAADAGLSRGVLRRVGEAQPDACEDLRAQGSAMRPRGPCPAGRCKGRALPDGSQPACGWRAETPVGCLGSRTVGAVLADGGRGVPACGPRPSARAATGPAAPAACHGCRRRRRDSPVPKCRDSARPAAARTGCDLPRGGSRRQPQEDGEAFRGSGEG